MKIFQNTKNFETCSNFFFIYLRSFVVRVTLIATVFPFVITTLNDRVFRNYNNFYFLCLHRLLHLMCRTITTFFHVCLSSANQVTFIDSKDRCMVLISFSISHFYVSLCLSFLTMWDPVQCCSCGWLLDNTGSCDLSLFIGVW